LSIKFSFLNVIITDMENKTNAIKFAEWCSNNRFWYNIDVEGTWYKLIPHKFECDLSKRYSTEELYVMYEASLKN